MKELKTILNPPLFCYYSLSSPFLLWHMNLSTANRRNYWTEFHETWWSYRYMFSVGHKVFSFVVKRVKSLMKELKTILNPPLFFIFMATAAKFVLPIPIVLAYLVPIDVDVT
jgi:hypothetical protein